MKHSAIAGLFITAALLASPAFAADKDLCTANIQSIEDSITTAGAVSEDSMDNVKAGLAKAKAAQAAGKDKDCVELTSSTMQKIEIRAPDKN